MEKFEGTFHDIYYDDTNIVLIRDKVAKGPLGSSTHAVVVDDLKAFLEATKK